MRKSLTYKVLAAVMAAGSLGLYAAAPAAAADNHIVKKDGEILNDEYNNVYGNGHSFTITGGIIGKNVYGVGEDDYEGDASGGNVSFEGGSTTRSGEVEGIDGNGYFVRGGYTSDGDAYNNTVSISGTAEVQDGVIGGQSSNGEAYYNTVNISDDAKVIVGTVYGGRSAYGSAHYNTVNISGGSVPYVVCGGRSVNRNAYHNTVNISGGTVGSVYGGDSASVGESISCEAYDNTVNISGGTVGSVYGGYSDSYDQSISCEAYDNTVNISGGSVSGDVYGGYVAQGIANNNEIIVSGSANITNANLYGYGRNDKASGTGNTLTIDGWSGTANSIHYFENIEFKNTTFTNGTVLNSQGQSNLDGLKNIKITNFAGGQNFNKGETLTLIKNTNNTTINEQNFNTTAGVAVDVGGVIKQDGNNVIMTINSTSLNSQTNLAAQTRAASAAFVNQGTDLISDSLDTISRDDNYGVKTFAAVHGNRSKYDVADDIKINGWSTIVGVGNADKFDNGSEFSWGVFYENGSGNYRTYNSFNNEFFRGDGSMVYNGGGIAARYENKNGVYTEGSLRAGMLKNELDNAMRNVNGSYGYETESAYYGAHIGVGKIISLSDSSDLDIYGKFFHTYTEGDSVTIADDKFDFDSITSDRLRVGARITSNKENKFSTYYGLAYEYEFNGDADMTAQGLRADTQSLQGSSVMAEVGFNYQPTPDSPWSFDLNMRGYAGERQGGSFNVQATYTF